MEALPEFLKPRLRVFLSADIVGSTALKQSPREGGQSSSEWFAIIQGFYIEAQRAFLLGWGDLKADTSIDLDLGEDPKLWKVIGDEIVFVKVLTDYRQLSAILGCWCAAIHEVRKFVKSRSSRLDIKCTAWTAGFPVMNKEVVVRTTGYIDDNSGDYYKESGELLNKRYAGESTPDFSVDYIGPAIDIGFRLASQASARKFVLSVGAAYILAITPLRNSRYPEFKIRYDGSIALKGVFGGAPYPIFWIDMAVDGDIALIEDKLTKRDACDRDVVAKYCNKFFEDNRSYTFPPFIVSVGESEIKQKPDWYDDNLTALARNYVLDDLSELSSEAAAAEEKAPDVDESKEEIELPAPTKSPTNSLNFSKIIKLLEESSSTRSAPARQRAKTNRQKKSSRKRK